MNSAAADPVPTRAAHRQASYRVRMGWGPTGAAAIAEGADVAVVADVLSFTTTLTVALERGMTVYPFRWRDERAAAYAAERDAVLAVGRSQPGVSLSPASVRAATGVERLVLPSPNGSAISFGLAASGVTVVGASLRNASAVARGSTTGAGTSPSSRPASAGPTSRCAPRSRTSGAPARSSPAWSTSGPPT